MFMLELHIEVFPASVADNSAMRSSSGVCDAVSSHDVHVNEKTPPVSLL